MDALGLPPIRWSSIATTSARYLATSAAVADVKKFLYASPFYFKGAVELVAEGKFNDPSAKFVTLCLAEVADPESVP